MKVAILTSPSQWFIPYAEKLNRLLENSQLFLDHKKIDSTFEIVFILSYHKIIEEVYLLKHKHNIVIHESALPQGKGWAPLFWQVLEGKDEIMFTMFEASFGVDDGNIYMQNSLHLTGYELNAELRSKQAELTLTMCIEFINNYNRYCNPKEQIGDESFYSKRTSKDSSLDINKSLKEQFNLLRIVNNTEYPAFFTINGYKYKIKIEKMEE